MLVDSREQGKKSAVILEHPIYDELLKQGIRIPESLATTTVNLEDVEKVMRGYVEEQKAAKYFDPVGQHELGKAYQKEAIFASAPVTVTEYNRVAQEIEADTESGLYVLVVEDSDSVIEPAHLLGQRLGWLGLLASLILLAVVVSMWLLVNRMLRNTRLKLSRSFAPAFDSSALEDMETVAAGEFLSPRTSRLSLIHI